MNKTKRLIVTLATTGTAMMVSFAISFLLTPFVTTKLGVEAYGFITLANTFISYAMIIATAFNSFATRFIAVAYHEQNFEKASSYISSLLICNLAIGILAIIICVPFVLNISSFLDVPASLEEDVKYLLLILSWNYLVTTATISFASAAYIRNRLDIYGVFQTLAHLAQAIVLIYMYVAYNPAVWFYGFAALISGFVLFAGNIFLYRKYAKEIKISPRYFSRLAVYDLLSVGIWSSVNSFGNALNNGLGILVSNIMLGATAMGQLAIARTFSTLFTRLYQLISQSVYPLILECWATGEINEVIRYLKLGSKMTGFVACLLFAGFYALCPFFYRLWIPNQDIDVIYNLTMLVMIYGFAEGPVQPLYYIYALTLKNKLPTVVTVIGGILNVALMIPLIEFTDLGIYAVPIVTAAIFLFVSFIFNPIYMAHCLGIAWHTFYPPIVRTILSCATCCLSFSIIAKAISPSNWLIFFTAVIFSCFLGAVIYLLIGLNNNEREALYSRVIIKQLQVL